MWFLSTSSSKKQVSVKLCYLGECKKKPEATWDKKIASWN